MAKKSNKYVNGFLRFAIENKALFLLLIICIVVACISNLFFTSRNLMNVLRQITYSSIVGIGFTLIVASGNLDLSVGYMLGFIGVVAALLSKIPGMPFMAVLLIAVVLGALCGFINATLGTLFRIPLFISTLAMGSVYRGTNYLLSDNAAVGEISPGLAAVGQGYLLNIPVPVWILLGVVVIIWILVNKTQFGRYILAIGGNSAAATASGIDVKKVTCIVFMIMGVCVALSGMVLTGRVGSAQPNAGQGMEMDAIAAVVIGGTPLSGGKCKVVGTLLGCLIVGVINNALNLMHVSTNWQIIAKGLMILFAVLLDTQFSRVASRRV